MKCACKKLEKRSVKNLNCVACSIDSDDIFYYQKKVLIKEFNPEFENLSFLYRNIIGKVIRRFLCLKFFSILIGRYFDSLHSIRSIEPFIKKYSLDMTDYEKVNYKSFNEFFVRKLCKGARDIDNRQNSLISPCDGKLFILPVINEKSIFYCKELKFNFDEFVGGREKAQQFIGGSLMIFRLAPYDYHRFHFPIDCIPANVVPINGKLESVNPFVYKQGIQVLTKNERHSILLRSESFGLMLMIAVGALCVGKIVETYLPNEPVFKGDEAGYFMFGGSTITLIVPPLTIIFDNEFIEHSKQGFETAVKMGQRIGELQPNVSFHRKEHV